MADDNEVEVSSLSLPGGVAREGWKTPAPPRGTLGYLRDQALGVAQGAIDVLQTPASLIRDAAKDDGTSAGMQTLQHAALNVKDWLGRGKTEYQQEQEAKLKAGGEDQRGILQEAGEMVVGTAPALGVAAATGPFAPLTFGALSVGASGLSAEETLRSMSEEDLKKTPVYGKFRESGMSDAEARRATYHEMRTLESIAPDMVMNTIFGGIAGRLVGKAFSKTVAGSMRQRIMRTVMQDVPEGVAGGAASGAATSYSRQQGEVQGGLREDVDWDEVQKAGIDVARPAGIISSAIALGRGVRRPGGRIHTPSAGKSTQEIFNQVDKATPEIGTDIKVVAGENLSDATTPKGPDAGAPRAPVNEGGAPTIQDELLTKINAKRAGEGKPPLTQEHFEAQVLNAGAAGKPADINPEGSTATVNRPADINPEGSTARVMPPRPMDAAASGFRDVDAIKEQIGHLESMGEHERATPEWRAEHQRLSQEYDRISEGATPKQELPPGAEQVITDITAPRGEQVGVRDLPDGSTETTTRLPDGSIETVRTSPDGYTERTVDRPDGSRSSSGGKASAAEAVTPPGKEPYTKEQLKAKLADPEQTPTLDAFQANVKEWRDANKGVKLPEHNDWQKEWTRAAGERAKTNKNAQSLQRETARKAKAEAAKAPKAEVPVVRLEEQPHPDPKVEALRLKLVEHEKAASAKDLNDPKWQAANDELYRAFGEAEIAARPKSKKDIIREQAVAKRHARTVAAAKAVQDAKDKPKKAVTRRGKKPAPKPEPPKVEPPAADLAALKGDKPIVDADEVLTAAGEKPVPEPPKKPTLTLKGKGGEPPEAAAPAPQKLVKKPKTAEEQAATDKAADIKHDQRTGQKNKREGMAKDVAGRLSPKDQELPEWTAREAAIREGKVEEVFGHVKEVAARAHQMVNEYLAELKILRGGNIKHETYNLGQFIGMDEAGNEIRGKARGQHGPYHSMLANLYNFDKEMQDHLARAENEKLTKEQRLAAMTSAKDGAVDFMHDLNLIREGKMEEYSAKIAARNEAIATKAKTDKTGQEGVDLAEAKRAAAGLDPKADVTKVAEQEERTTAKMTDAQLAARGLPTNADMKRMMRGHRTKRDVENWGKEPDEHGLDHNEWVNGTKLGIDQIKLLEIEEAQQKYWESLGSPQRGLTMDEFLEVADYVGDPITRSTLGEEMKPFRPTGDRFVDQVMRKVFDAVHDMVKDMPALTMSPELLETKVKDARAGYSGEWGAAVFRPDTKVARTVIHEALHAATYRALEGSKRLTHLVSRLQNIIKYNEGLKPYRETEEFHRAFNSDPHEFISELFTRPEVRAMVASVKLSLRDVLQLRKAGYQIDKGKTLLGTLWGNFLKAIGFQPAAPDAMKVAIDMVQDVFEREHQFRARDVALGRTDIGRIYSDNEIRGLARQDPIWGTAAANKIRAGDHAGAADALMNMADKMDARTADTSIKYLTAVNEGYWGGRMVPDAIVPMGTPASLRGDFANFLNKKLENSKGSKDLGWQIKNKFATQLRHLSQGIRYTNDLGNNLEEGFQKILQPLKNAWSKREHFAQEYMLKEGANALIDKMARIKNAITDRTLWDNFQRLMIRESYARAFADEELGTGRNSHIDTGSRRDRQSVADHKINRELYEKHVMNHPQLKELRNEVHAFMAKEMEARHKYMARDMILKEGVAKSGDDAAISALVKNIRHEDATMSPKEKAAFDRAVGAHDSAAYKDWEEKRATIRKLIQESTKAGPHVPFMRHGKHVVYAEYDVKPDAGVKYNEVNPEKTGEINKIYDFVQEKDADHFIDNTLNHPDVEINVRNAHDIVYDTQTGKRASVYTDAEMKAFADKGEKHTNRYLTPKDLKQMEENNIPTGHYETRYRVEFNPTEYVRFESEREAHDFREMRNADHSHPNVSTRVTHVETPKDLIGRANVAYTSAELQQWINRMEASPAYQQMTEEQKLEWKREMRIEAARVTMTAGRRTMMMPREYAKGASLDLLKNTIDFAGNNARAHAELMYRDDIDKGRQMAHDYAHQFRYSTGRPPPSADPALSRTLPEGTPKREGLSRDEMLEQTGHRARQDVLMEIDRRLFAPPQVEGSWAIGIKRALQVSMISHLADTAYLMVNAMEPWIFGAAITASRHGMKTYAEMAEATALIDVPTMGKKAFGEWIGAGKELIGVGDARQPHTNYEKHLLDAVTGERNKRGDGERLGRAMNHMFSRGLVARDVGMEMERIHDPSKGWIFRKLDSVDAMFRAANTGIEAHNRAISAISNFRLEYPRALEEIRKADEIIKKEKKQLPDPRTAEARAEEQAIAYAEDMVFKGAGDYSAWNNPRYMRNPFVKLAGQFKKYPLRIASVWVDAMIGAARGNREKQKQIAFMFVAQALAGGAFSSPLSVIPGGLVNAMYILGATDDTWEDWMFETRKALVNGVGIDGADAIMNGVLDFSGANFSSRFDNSSPVFFGDPESRNSAGLFAAMGKLALGAPGDSAFKLKDGINKIFEAQSHFSAGANEKGYQAASEATEKIIQIKQLHDLVRAVTLANSGPPGMPKGNEASTIQAAVQAIGFTPTEVARKQEEKRVFKREMKQESTARNIWIERWRDAPNSAAQNAMWRTIQRDYNSGIKDQRLHITQGELFKAKQRKRREEARDSTKLGIKLSGRQKAFADIHHYYSED